jgi:hypothetical protein
MATDDIHNRLLDSNLDTISLSLIVPNVYVLNNMNNEYPSFYLSVVLK